MDVDEMIEQILSGLGEIEGMPDRHHWSNTEWTRKIKTVLCEVGTNLHYSVWASGVDNTDGGEWLYDVCWLDYDGNDGNWLRRMPMAAESEWKNIGEIEDDFSRLLVARASLKVMVCDGWWLPDDTEGQATAERLRQSVHEFEDCRVGDTYLLIIFEWHENQWRSHSWRYRMSVAEAGELTALERC